MFKNALQTWLSEKRDFKIFIVYFLQSKHESIDNWPITGHETDDALEKCIMHHAKDITSHKPQSTGQLLVRIEFRDLQIILPL